MIRPGRILLPATLAIVIALGQSAQPTFDVASVKLVVRPLESGGGAWIVNHGRFKADAAGVRTVIAFAFGVMSVQVHGGPMWVDTERYDFVAKAESAEAGPDQIKPMLQTLLADRFKLATHRETQEIPMYTLTVGKSGSKMQEAKEAGKTYVNFTGPGHVVFTKCNMLGLIHVLASTLGSPVLDKTELKGLYDFKLEFTDPRFHRPGNSNEPIADSPPDIFRAVQEQLGLKLEAKKAPAEILVIDHVERATEN